MAKRYPWIWFLVASTGALAFSFWLGTLGQPLIDIHEFRQTQTALSALFMQPGLDGLLNYQTPVAGYPWSIPFEFPLLQWLSHHLANNSALNLSTSGRLLSVLFGLGCIFPAIRLMDRYGLSFVAKGIFVSLYFSSSIYLYWNRAFLMESTALFFTLVSLDVYFALCSNHFKKPITIYLFASTLGISLTLGLLVKATTALPALGLFGFGWILQTRKVMKTGNGSRAHLSVLIALVLAFALLYVWTQHADALKLQNQIGSSLTSSSLRNWNFGQLEQRFNTALWIEVIAKRMLTTIAAVPIALIVIAGFRKASAQSKYFILGSIYLSLAPLLIFTNLHIVHNYYQAGNQIFLLMAIAASSEVILLTSNSTKSTKIVIVGILIIILSNLFDFHANYLYAATNDTSDKLVAGRIIQSATPSDSSILVFGDDWSSAFAFHGMRRAFTLPNWPGLNLAPADILSNPKKYLNGSRVGAVVSSEELDPKSLRSACSLENHHNVNYWHIYICKS